MLVCRRVEMCVYIYIWYPPQKKDLGSHILIYHQVVGSQSEIDGMGLRVGGFRV